MKIGFVVNKVSQESTSYTTTGLALTAHKRGHEVYYIGVGDFTYTADGQMGAHARKAPETKFRNAGTFLTEIKETPQTMITAADLDVLMLRNDPAEEIEKRPWAQSMGVIFGQLAVKQGVIVLNDPGTLNDAINKMYFQHYPEKVRPRTVITRNVDDITEFFKESKGKMVLKPLQGSGGRNVFLVTKKEANNINQMFEAISRDGYVVAQEYLPEAQEGDVRLFLVNGRPIEVDGKIAALHRLQKDGEIRSNIHRGGKAGKATITDEVLEIVETVRPKLVGDGMFFVGLDIVGSYLMEINVFSPGGLNNASQLYGVDFITPVIEAIEQKLRYMELYPKEISNKKIATI
jgi:glutathione synthase